MKIHQPQTLKLRGSVITIGAFDGVHIGHQEVIKCIVEQAKTLNVPSVIYTFDPPPKAYFNKAKVLTSYEVKMQKLNKLGLDYAVIASFNTDYLNRTADSFIEELHLMNPLKVIVGEVFRFGYQRTGDIHLLRKYFQVETISPVCCSDGQRISSTRIRELISRGEMEKAIPLLS